MTDHETPAEPTGLSRRGLLGIGAAGGAMLAASGVFTGTAAANASPGERDNKHQPDPDDCHRWPVNPAATTLAHTLLRGPAGVGGYRHIVKGPGEPHLVRDELVPAALRRGKPHDRRGILALGHLTDMHVMDAQSPARVEFLDRYNDPDFPYASVLPFESSYRAHELLSAHVADAMVQAINSVRHAPVTGLPLAFTISTGDNADNTQYNEVRWQIDLLDGERVRPDSGDLSKYEGVMDATHYDQRYWHPDGAPAGSPPDAPTATYGFPKVPGLLDTARKPFHAAGLATPWLSVFGNHDGLVQGNVPSNPLIASLATGPAKIIGLAPGVDILTLAQGLAVADPAALQTLFSGPVRLVTPDANRRPLSRVETIAEHFKSSGHPHGHGYTAANLHSGKANYAFDSGVVRGLVLDTVNPNGGADGSIDADQLAWLSTELTAGSSRYLDAAGKPVRARQHRDRLFVIFSHHTIDTMSNAAGVGRVLGPQVRDLLLRFPNVILWVNGHTHRNTVTPQPRAAGSATAGGFWEINTASHIDWPEQARVIEVVDNRDSTLSVFGTMIDHAAPLSYGRHPSTPLQLAGLSRQLGANDWQNAAPSGGEDGRRGAVQDRNVELLLPTPFALTGH